MKILEAGHFLLIVVHKKLFALGINTKFIMLYDIIFSMEYKSCLCTSLLCEAPATDTNDFH
jgi:hypothetical protein